MRRKPRFQNTGAGKGIKERLDPRTLERLYYQDRLTQAQIAARYDCTPQFVSLLMHEYGFPPHTSPAGCQSPRNVM